MFYFNLSKFYNYILLFTLSIFLFLVVRFYFLLENVQLVLQIKTGLFFNFVFVVDYVNYFFILLLVIIYIISYFSFILDFKKVTSMFALTFTLSFISLLFSFLSYDIFTFYIFFEITFFQFSYFLLKYGQSIRKKKSFVYFILYSLLGSFFFFISIFIIYFNYGLHIIYCTNLIT